MFARVSSLRELATQLGARSASALPTRPEGFIPVPDGWVGLFTDGGIRRGSTISVGSLSVAAALLGAATGAGLWCAVVGVPELSATAAVRAGVALCRCAFVTPASEVTAVVGALMEGVDVVVLGKPSKLPAVVTRQLAARARVHGTVVIGVGHWPGVDMRIRVTAATWSGIHAGYGRLVYRQTRLSVDGRRVPVPRQVDLDWPLDGRG